MPDHLDLLKSRILIREFAQECRADGLRLSRFDRSSFAEACKLLRAECRKCELFALACQFEKACASLFLSELRSSAA